MTYVLENKNIEGQYIAKNMDVALSSTLYNGDVEDLELALIFDDEFDLMCFAAEQGVHRTIMKMVYGEHAIVSMDIDIILQKYRPKKVSL